MRQENWTEHAAVQDVVSSTSVQIDPVISRKASSEGQRKVGANAPDLETPKKEQLVVGEDGEEFAMFGFGC